MNANPSTHAIQPNTLELFGRSFLLVEGGGSAVHVATRDEECGRPAFEDYDFALALSRGLVGEEAALRAATWSPRTLCGRAWARMAVTEETVAVDSWCEPGAHAPSCRRCLQILDR